MYDCSNCPGKEGYCDINGICDDNETLCDDDRKGGPGCNISCLDKKEHCLRCDRNFKCIQCTDTTYHGEHCREVCEGCSDTGCDIKGYCREFKCQNATYGLKCDQKCSCESNSNSPDCGKFGAQCLNCKFGYYGKDCIHDCYYKCQTELCCIFKKDKDNIKSRLEISTNYKYLDINIEGKPYKFEIDYNYGYPLTIFNKYTSKGKECDNLIINNTDFSRDRKRDLYTQNFTNYNINSSLYENITININNTELTVELTFANYLECKSKVEYPKEINGVIGLGFFNSISNAFFERKQSGGNDLNILSYSLDGENVSLLFGNLFEEQIDYVERLTSCDVILDKESDIQGKKMTCKLDGIKSAQYSEAFRLENAYITFSLGEESSLILGNNQDYEKYLKNIYFKNDETTDDSNNEIKYFSYPKDKINKLPNFGFVFNNFFYSYPPDKFFKEDKFLIKINKTTERTEFIIGKDFLNDIKFTINNEEAKIYFYAKNAEFSDKFNNQFNISDFGIKLEARESAAVCLAIIVFINIFAFGVYYFIKQKKKFSEDYARIE